MLGVCSLEHEVPAKSTSHIPNSISCLDDNEENPFLHQASSPRIEKRALDACEIVSLQRGLAYRAILHASGTVFVPLSVPIYQSKTVYQI